MRIPAATYRIQFNPDFGFEAARHIAPYLVELGVSDLYASPIFKPRQGSTHGYDVVNPNQLNPELGTPEQFQALIQTLQDHQIGWLQDIVPNHMAYDSQNPFLMDILEHGPNSEYFNYFDIEWEHSYNDIKGKVLAPLLGDFYGNCLEKGEIQLQYAQEGLTVHYYGLKLPIRIESYTKFLTHGQERLAQSLGREHPDYIKLLGILYFLKDTPLLDHPGEQRKDQAYFVKTLLWELYTANEAVQKFVQQNLGMFNGEVGKPESFALLDDLLSEQFYRLSFWKVGAEELNYRRFFTINELICVRVEDVDVFNATHDLVSQLVADGQITGLRIDHIDGLYNPTHYLQWLREKMGDAYIVVEKILELGQEYFSRSEELPDEWPVQGTTGYDFLTCVNALFCQRENYRQFSDLYTRFSGVTSDYEALIAEKKRIIADKNLAGDVENLANFLKRLAGQHRYGRDFTLNGLRRAILEVLILFPIYRTYTSSQGLREKDRVCVLDVLRQAKMQLPILVNELNFIEKILLLEYDDNSTPEDQAQWLHFVMKFQQFSGPLMAKGFEDTFLYVYHRFVSLNDVGGMPHQFGITIPAFHSFTQKRQDRWPHTMNATATHDTKRGEDFRARLNVLSEIPTEWEAQVTAWGERNPVHKAVVGDRLIPDRNDEYFLYQTLVGAFPFEEHEYPGFIERIKEYVIKAVREAKVHTAWLHPDTDYEEGFVQFIDRLLQPTEENLFLAELRAFQQRIVDYGILNSLSQTLLKLTVPGVPDVYQGTELWDLSLVDPDNRRPVDFERRRGWLQDLKMRAKSDVLGLLAELHETRTYGGIKFYLTTRTLHTRQKYRELFQQGSYIALEVMGKHREHIVAFARHYGDQTAIVVVPRLLTGLVEPGQLPVGRGVWGETRIEIPQGLQGTWKDVFAEHTVKGGDTLAIAQILKHFPVGLLINKKRSPLSPPMVEAVTARSV